MKCSSPYPLLKAARKISLLAGGIILAALAIMPQAQAVFVVTPNTAATTQGNSGNGYPFGADNYGNGAVGERYQQLYSAAFFSPAINPVIGLYITDISFRLDDTSSTAAFASTLPSVRIDLSTTRVADDALSTTFANNVGASDTIVYGGINGSPLPLSNSNTTAANGTKTFDITIHLETPFLYRPTNGNLLLDVRNFGGGVTAFFDAVNTPNDGVSRVLSLPGSESASTAYASDSLGLVTAFTLSGNIPEPSTWAMLLSGLTVTLIWRIKSQDRSSARLKFQLQ